MKTRSIQFLVVAVVTVLLLSVVSAFSDVLVAKGVLGEQIVDNLYILSLLPIVAALLASHLRDRIAVRRDVALRAVWFSVVLAATALVLALVTSLSWGGTLAVRSVTTSELTLYAASTLGQALTEELIFRVGLPILITVRAVTADVRSPTTAFLSCVGFVAWHITSSPVAALDHFLFALLMYELFCRTGSLAVPVLAHVVNNLVAGLTTVTGGTSDLLPHLAVVGVKYSLLFLAVSVFFGGIGRPYWLPSADSAQEQRVQPPIATRLPSLDLLRGLALLLIMVENLLLYLPADSAPATISTADRVTRTILALVVEFRGLPLFALLLGFSTYMLFAREDGIRIVRRRAWAFVLIGGLHGVYVFSADILAVYGLLLLVMPRFARSRRPGLCIGFAGIALVLQAFIAPLLHSAFYTGSSGGSMLEQEWLVGAQARPWEWLAYFAATPFVSSGYLLFMFIGFVTGRWMSGQRSALSEVAVRWGPPLGGVASIVMSAPHASLVFQNYGGAPIFQGDVLSMVLAQLAAAVSAISVWVWIVCRPRSAPPSAAGPSVMFSAVTKVSIANGQRSLSGYLLHSAILVVLLPGYGADLARLAGPTVLVLSTLLLWLLLGRRPVMADGPAESIVRALAAPRGRAGADHVRQPLD